MSSAPPFTFPDPVVLPEEQHWKQQLRHAISDSHRLLAMLGLQHLTRHTDFSNPFPLRVPLAYANKMRHGDANDPLLLQVLPQIRENADSGHADPVADLQFMPSPGLLHKYHGRALLITTGACAVHCRYCFRRHYPYADAGLSSKQLVSAMDYLRQHPEIDEIILSGGDPLVLDNTRLSALLEPLQTLPQLRYLRLHTRLPVVLPDRITSALVNLLCNSRFRISMVIHCNHAQEIGEQESAALQRLHQAGVTLLNQSVLLKNVNDNADSLIALSKALYDNHVLPYYLHCLDPVKGGMHFNVSETRGRAIVEQMRACLPGYLLPRLVREIPDSPSKTAISGI